MSGLKHTIRNLLKQKIFLGINVFGLSMAITFAITGFLYMQNELKYDDNFTNVDEAYLLACNNGSNRIMHFGQPIRFLDDILNEVPEVRNATRVMDSDENILINQSRILADDFVFADTNFFEFMGWELIEGRPEKVLETEFSITISQEIVDFYFKGESPLGKTVNIGNKYDFTITGIFKTLPEETHLKTDFIASLSSIAEINDYAYYKWGSHGTNIYIKLNDNSSEAIAEKKIAEAWNNNCDIEIITGSHIKSQLMPFNRVYLDGDSLAGYVSRIDYLKVFSLVVLFIIVLSCFNFINLSIANQKKKLLSLGVKKVLGASRSSLVKQDGMEIVFYLLISLLVSFVGVHILLPFFNGIFEKQLSLNLFQNGQLAVFIICLLICIGVLCSGVRLIRTLKLDSLQLLKGRAVLSDNKKDNSSKEFIKRSALVMVQFTIGIILVISTIVVNEQLKLIRKHNMGFNKEHLLFIENHEGDISQRYELLKQELEKISGVMNVTCGSQVPLDGVHNWGAPCLTETRDELISGCGYVSIEKDYLNVIGASVISGSGFSNNESENYGKIVINEAMANALHVENPVGLSLDELWDGKSREIAGVINDIEYTSIQANSFPIIYFYGKDHFISYNRKIIVKLQGGNIGETIKQLETKWGMISPEYPLTYSFLDEQFDENYKSEIQVGRLLNLMTFVAIAICCLGLFALAYFNINSRIKEIGVRRVNGAKSSEIIIMLNKEFIKSVVIAYIVALPIAYYALNLWLQGYSEKVTIGSGIMVFAGVLTFTISIITVSVQSWKAATRNPVEALRYE